MEWNGIELIELQGIELERIEWNYEDLKWNGIELS
jgi:hypothetical protein